MDLAERPIADAPAPSLVAWRSPLSLLLRVYPALRNPHFRLLWLGMLPSTICWQLSVIAAPYAAFQLVGSATILGVVSLATGLPLALLSLVGGVAADRFPRRRVLITTQSTLS